MGSISPAHMDWIAPRSIIQNQKNFRNSFSQSQYSYRYLYAWTDLAEIGISLERMNTEKREALYSSVEKALRKRFTKFDGWDLLEESQARGGLDFLFEYRWKKKTLYVLCMIALDAATAGEALERLIGWSPIISSGEIIIFTRILAIPEEGILSQELEGQLEKYRIEILLI
jgi:hypothetical protein